MTTPDPFPGFVRVDASTFVRFTSQRPALMWLGQQAFDLDSEGRYRFVAVRDSDDVEYVRSDLVSELAS